MHGTPRGMFPLYSFVPPFLETIQTLWPKSSSPCESTCLVSPGWPIRGLRRYSYTSPGYVPIEVADEIRGNTGGNDSREECRNNLHCHSPMPTTSCPASLLSGAAPFSESAANSSNRHDCTSAPRRINPSEESLPLLGLGLYESGTICPSLTSNAPTISSGGTAPCGVRVR